MSPKRRPAGVRRSVRAPPRRRARGRPGTSGARLAPLRRAAGALGPRLARLPPVGWALIGLVLAVLVNFAVQVARKPTELLGLVFAPAPLTAEQTWERYGPLARESSTDVIRPELLAALIQVESAGDPLARTYWRWSWTLDPFHVWAPASSAVGLLQITDGTYDQARHYCIHDHRVVRDDGPVGDSCWFNAFYFRTVPGHSIEMTAAWLHVSVAEALGRLRAADVPAARRDAVAAAVHLCGRARAAALVSNGFRPRAGERCGDHDLRAYLERVRALTVQFERMERTHQLEGEPQRNADAGVERSSDPDRRP
jgi:hypothetical protein